MTDVDELYKSYTKAVEGASRDQLRAVLDEALQIISAMEMTWVYSHGGKDAVEIHAKKTLESLIYRIQVMEE